MAAPELSPPILEKTGGPKFPENRENNREFLKI
jgi:hypothetical protein